MDAPYSAIPSDDSAFRKAVEDAARNAADAETLRRLVRVIYPDAEVVVQDPLGAMEGAQLRIYIFRDGAPPTEPPS